MGTVPTINDDRESPLRRSHSGDDKVAVGNRQDVAQIVATANRGTKMKNYTRPHPSVPRRSITLGRKQSQSMRSK